MKTVTGRGYVRAVLAIAVTMAMVWGTGAAAGTARAQDAITGVQAPAQAPTTQTSTMQTPVVKQANAITSDGIPIAITELAVDTGNASNSPTNDTGRTPSANGNHAPDESAGDQYEQRGGGRQSENAGTRVLSSTGADITHIGAALLLLLTVGSMLVAMVMPGKRRGDGARE